MDARADSPRRPSYVLVTPARNEERYIEQTLASVLSQTVRPARWVIVNDGSTDGTDEILDRYARRHDWIELVRMPPRRARHFAGKVHAFAAGAARLAGLPYDIIGNLDADVSFEPDCIEYLLDRFVERPGLGVAGTNYRQGAPSASPRSDYRITSDQDVPGALQLFRRECFEAIGGYTPSRHGGVDLLANLRARMEGWTTTVYPDRVLLHHRVQGTADVHPWLVEFHNGRKDYMFGSHPLWQLCRGAYRLTRPPYVVGGASILLGYLSAWLTRTPRVFPADVVRFRRTEQMRRLRAWCHLKRFARPRGEVEINEAAPS